MAQPSSSSAPPPEPINQHENENGNGKNPSLQEPKPSPSISPPKKIPPLPWTHLETVNLIEVYQNKWYSLKRGQLKANQWEEVAISVAARCGFDEPSKTATQCRHKMEKLRKRYRSEKQRSTISTWTYFDLMDQMERGPFPISVRPIATIDPNRHHQHHHQRTSDSTDDDSDDVDDNVPDVINKSRSINHILRRPPIVSRIVDNSSSPRPQWNGIGSSGPRDSDSRLLRNPMYRKRRRSFEIEEEEEEEEKEEEEGGGGGELLMELASVIRKFGEGFVKIENMKMEMMKETEKHRMEMESKRTKMILDSQHRIVDAIAKAFCSRKKIKESQEM
ncbi:MADF domain [Macleaya cordata]|uniref:MADF domain n=1 Tax=Macleaya cordata TaxID=56857 RepID=A0A200QBV0_MACCD|nr:MADF domain [Macleaya cordata]